MKIFFKIEWNLNAESYRFFYSDKPGIKIKGHFILIYEMTFFIRFKLNYLSP